MSAKLYVGNISFQMTENDLEDLFSQIGKVAQVNLIMDRATQRPRGFAFVTMDTPEDAQKAIEQLNGQTISGRRISVNEARPPEDRPRRFEGGGGGGRPDGPRFGGGGGGGGGRDDHRRPRGGGGGYGGPKSGGRPQRSYDED